MILFNLCIFLFISSVLQPLMVDGPNHFPLSFVFLRKVTVSIINHVFTDTIIIYKMLLLEMSIWFSVWLFRSAFTPNQWVLGLVSGWLSEKHYSDPGNHTKYQIKKYSYKCQRIFIESSWKKTENIFTRFSVFTIFTYLCSYYENKKKIVDFKVYEF